MVDARQSRYLSHAHYMGLSLLLRGMGFAGVARSAERSVRKRCDVSNRTEHGPRWENPDPGAGCNSTHVARTRRWWKNFKHRVERHIGGPATKFMYFGQKPPRQYRDLGDIELSPEETLRVESAIEQAERDLDAAHRTQQIRGV